MDFTRKLIYEYAELLSGYSLQYFMLDQMDRDIEMECPTFIDDEKNPMWEDYIEEVIDWTLEQESITNTLAMIIRYSREENTDRFGRS